MVTLTILFSLGAYAKSPELLKCLGAEEKRFHLKKDLGPGYDLNQKLIAEIVQIPHATVKPAYYQQICIPAGNESLKLLQLSITKGKDLFDIPNTVTGMQLQMTQGMIDDYFDAIKEIFLGYISQIQSLSPTPTCLQEEIPGLEAFFREIKYLQEDVDIKVLFEKKDEKIFGYLKDYPQAFQRCRDRLRKKLKSESTAPAKKP